MMETAYKVFKSKKYALDKNNIWDAIYLLLINFAEIKKSPTIKKYDIVRVGGMYIAEAYFHELDQYYECIGIEVEFELQYDFEDKSEICSGFFCTWKGKCHPAANVTFEIAHRKFGDNIRFEDGSGDHAEIFQCLIPADEMQKYYNQFLLKEGDQVRIIGGDQNLVNRIVTITKTANPPAPQVYIQGIGPYHIKYLKKI